MGITLLLLLAAALNLFGCAGIAPAKDTSDLVRAADTKEKGNIRVSVAVLTESESKDYFGRSLKVSGVQAVWLRVENRNSFPVWILPRFTDLDYFSTFEAAYRNHSVFRRTFNEAIDASFQKYAIAWRMEPGKTNTGFLFVHVNEGATFVNVELWHSKGIVEYRLLSRAAQRSFRL